MPLEIRELVIKTTVNSDRTARTPFSHNLGHHPGSRGASLSEADRSAVISACVAKVLDILKAKSER